MQTGRLLTGCGYYNCIHSYTRKGETSRVEALLSFGIGPYGWVLCGKLRCYRKTTGLASKTIVSIGTLGCEAVFELQEVLGYCII